VDELRLVLAPILPASQSKNRVEYLSATLFEVASGAARRVELGREVRLRRFHGGVNRFKIFEQVS